MAFRNRWLAMIGNFSGRRCHFRSPPQRDDWLTAIITIHAAAVPMMKRNAVPIVARGRTKRAKNGAPAVALAKLRAQSLTAEERSEIGRMGGTVGGAARAKKLTKAERQAIAKKAAQARWGGKSRRTRNERIGATPRCAFHANIREEPQGQVRPFSGASEISPAMETRIPSDRRSAQAAKQL
jgi:hypothetical protein